MIATFAVITATAMLAGLLSTGDGAVIVALIGFAATAIGMRNRRDIKQISHAVNHVGKGEPTLIETVGWLKDVAKWSVHAHTEFARRVGITLDRPPEPLVHKDPKQEEEGR